VSISEVEIMCRSQSAVRLFDRDRVSISQRRSCDLRAKIMCQF